jgi:hypothetical protein
VGGGQLVEQPERPGVGRDAVGLQEVVEHVVLAVAEGADGAEARWVVLRSVGQLDVARLQEGAHPVEAGAST